MIDDDLSCIKSLENAIRPANHNCSLFNNPVEGVSEFKNNEYDAVLTDIRMPGMNGIEVLKEVRKHKSSTRVIIMTGYTDVDNAIDAVNNGAYAFFRKPLNIEEVLDILFKIEKDILKEKNNIDAIKRLEKENRLNKDASESLSRSANEMTSLYTEKNNE